MEFVPIFLNTKNDNFPIFVGGISDYYHHHHLLLLQCK